MEGQWIGSYSGTNSGLIVIDIDDCGSYYEGTARAFDDDPSLPATYAVIKTVDKRCSHDLHIQLQQMEPQTGVPTSWDALSKRFEPNILAPDCADVHIEFSDDVLNISWKTDLETSGAAQITRIKHGTPTEYQPLLEVSCWGEFKDYVTKLDHRRFIFRGQDNQHRLRTGFHRTRRAELKRFADNDIRTLHRHLSLRTSHIFNLSVPDENGAFLNLVQHHGYPTPLLDWTYSPFVAAFFAFHQRTNAQARCNNEERVRIFIFDQRGWQHARPQIPLLAWQRPHFSLMEFMAIDNERLTPQQSISTLTNVDDIESFIRSKEIEDKRKYLTIIDLPLSERPHVMKELSIMGITAGSLFPGLDGACKELRERFFDL